jgi:CubicO group peptidase (beta-lactamase class C family)
VRLTDPLSKFIPELKGLQVAVLQGPPAPAPASGAPAPRYTTVRADHEITIRDLLTHTSGLVSGPMSNGAARPVALKGQETLADYLPRLARTPLEFQPGTRWAYSAQAGFDALARVVEVASGMPFDRFARQRIFEPLAMRDTFFYPADGHPRLVTLYQRTAEGPLRKQATPNFMNGAYFSGGGGLMSTAEDYLQFAQMLLNGGVLSGRRLLGERTVTLMSSVYAPDSLPGRPRGEGYGLSVRVVSSAVDRNTFLSDGSFGWSGLFGTHFWWIRRRRSSAS